MNIIEIDKEEAFLTMHIDSIKEEFIISVTKYEDDSTFGLCIKISSEDGFSVKNILLPFDLILPLKGTI